MKCTLRIRLQCIPMPLNFGTPEFPGEVAYLWRCGEQTFFACYCLSSIIWTSLCQGRSLTLNSSVRLNFGMQHVEYFSQHLFPHWVGKLIGFESTKSPEGIIYFINTSTFYGSLNISCGNLILTCNIATKRRHMCVNFALTHFQRLTICAGVESKHFSASCFHLTFEHSAVNRIQCISTLLNAWM